MLKTWRRELEDVVVEEYKIQENEKWERENINMEISEGLL